jgi:hypothetical protein
LAYILAFWNEEQIKKHHHEERKTNTKIASMFAEMCLFHYGAIDGKEEICRIGRPSCKFAINKPNPQCKHESLNTHVERTLSNCCTPHEVINTNWNPICTINKYNGE